MGLFDKLKKARTEKKELAKAAAQNENNMPEKSVSVHENGIKALRKNDDRLKLVQY